MKTFTLLTILLTLASVSLMSMKPALAQDDTVKVIFDKGTFLPGWKSSVTEGAIKGSEIGGAEFTLEAWQKGRDFWPRLSCSGPAVDVSAYTRLILEIENPAATTESIAVSAQGNSEDSVRFSTQLSPKTISKVVLDISDGATVDASSINEIVFYMRQPTATATYIVRRISAIKNPDYISQRAALGLQLQEAERSLGVLKKAAGVQKAAVEELQEQLDGLSTAYGQRASGYVPVLQKGLLTAQSSIARLGMDSRAADLWLWGAPLGVALRQDTLPSPADAALAQVRETVCLNQYKAICVNLSAASKAQSLKIRLDGAPTQSGLLSLRPTHFSKARDGSMTADAIGLETGELAVEIPAYQSQQILIWVDTKFAGARAGKFTARLEVRENGGELVKEIPVDITVANVRLADRLPVSITNWAYFYLGSTPVTAGLEREAVANLRDYGANTWNLDYSQVPLPQLDAAGKYTGLDPNVLVSFRRVLELLKGRPHESLVVWLGFQREPIRQALAKPGVLKGYLKDIRAVLDEFKVPMDKRYLMLWDEPHIVEFRESLEWMKKIRALDPTLKFYDDGSAIPNDDKELAEFVKLTDRWFPNWEQLYIARPEAARKIQAMNIPGLGFYRCLVSRNNRGVNIYEYYRLMGWYTMQHGFETLAFWVYNVGEEDPWDGTKGSTSGAIVVYNKDGKLLTSRRWELFREGLDDYKLAQAAFGAKGIVDARKHPQLQQLCEAVAANPQDAAKADQMRGRLIDLAVKNKGKTKP